MKIIFGFMVSQYICIDEGTGDKTMKVELHFGDVKGTKRL